MLIRIFKPYISEDLENIISHFLKSQNRKLWLEIKTDIPRCTYYFGPFDKELEARHQSGYIEDLLEEKAVNITARIKKTHPVNLTIDRKK